MFSGFRHPTRTRDHCKRRLNLSKKTRSKEVRWHALVDFAQSQGTKIRSLAANHACRSAGISIRVISKTSELGTKRNRTSGSSSNREGWKSRSRFNHSDLRFLKTMTRGTMSRFLAFRPQFCRSYASRKQEVGWRLPVISFENDRPKAYPAKRYVSLSRLTSRVCQAGKSLTYGQAGSLFLRFLKHYRLIPSNSLKT